MGCALAWGSSQQLGLIVGRRTYLPRRRLVTRAAALFSYAQPRRWRLMPISQGQLLGLSFPHDSQEFFSLVRDGR
jgi:hypothetical protein